MTASVVTSTFESTIVEFCETATWINTRLLDNDNNSGDVFKQIDTRVSALFPVAQKYNESFTSNDVCVSEELLLRLENVAGTLWNTIIVSRVNVSTVELNSNVLTRCLLFNAILLSLFDTLTAANDKSIRSLKCFVTVMKSLVERGIDNKNTSGFETELSYTKTWVVNRIKHFSDHINQLSQIDIETYHQLCTQFYAYAFQACINEGDSETALLYLNKIDCTQNDSKEEANIVLEVARVLYNSALKVHNETKNNENLQQTDYRINFLKRANELTSLQNQQLRTHINYTSLRYAILVLLTQCLIERTGEEENEVVNAVLEELMKTYPKKVKPFHLGILFRKKEHRGDFHESISSLMMQMMLSVDIEGDYEDLLFTLHECSKFDLKACLTSIDYIFQNRVKHLKNKKVIERLLLTRFYITLQTKLLNETEIILNLTDFYTIMERTLCHTLTLETCSSIITLIWNFGKKLEKSGAYSTCCMYYELSLRDIISSNYTDRSKLYRAMASAYISANELNKAHSILDTMPIDDKVNPLTLFISLRLHMLQGDATTSESIIEKLSNSSDKKSLEVFVLSLNLLKTDPVLLTKSAGLLFRKLQGESNNDDAPIQTKWLTSTVDLIRFTIQSLLKINDGNIVQLIDEALHIRNLFNEPLNYISKLKTIKMLNVHETPGKESSECIDMNVDEIEWFSSTAFNLASQLFRMGNNFTLAKMFSDISLEYMSLIPFDEFTTEKNIHFRYRNAVCETLSLSIRYEAIQTNENIVSDSVMATFLELGRGFQKLTTDIKKLIADFKRSQVRDPELENRIRELLHNSVYSNFEILIKSRDEKAIMALLKFDDDFDNSSFYENIADLVLQTEGVPMQLRKSIILTILQNNITNKTENIENAYYWMKCTFKDWKSSLSSVDYALFYDYSAKLKGHFSNLDGITANSEIKETIENIASICWNFGVTQFIEGSQSALEDWCRLAFRYAKYGRTGFLEQMLELWFALTASANLTDPENLTNVFDYEQY